MTWYFSLPSNCSSDSGVCTVPMTSMVPVSSALFSAVGSLKYCSVTVSKYGASPQ